MSLLWCLCILFRCLKSEKQKDKFDPMAGPSLNCLVRFAYTALLELTVSSLLALSLALSAVELVFGVILLIVVVAGLAGLCIIGLRGATKHDEATFEKKAGCSSTICCWGSRKLTYEAAEITKDGVAAISPA